MLAPGDNGTTTICDMFAAIGNQVQSQFVIEGPAGPMVLRTQTTITTGVRRRRRFRPRRDRPGVEVIPLADGRELVITTTTVTQIMPPGKPRQARPTDAEMLAELWVEPRI